MSSLKSNFVIPVFAVCLGASGCNQTSEAELSYSDEKYDGKDVASESIFEEQGIFHFTIEAQLEQELKTNGAQNKFVEILQFAQSNTQNNVFFQNYGFHDSDWGTVHSFFEQAKPTQYPGICVTTSHDVGISLSNPNNMEYQGRSVSYGIVGSTAPQSMSAKYEKEFAAACKGRIDNIHWVETESEKEFVKAARLAELVITSAKQQKALPFLLTQNLCDFFSHQLDKDDHTCEFNLRETLASLNHRSVIDINIVIE